MLYAAECMGYRFVSPTPEDIANVNAGVWRSCKGNFRNLFSKII
jgi:hypothetical protein